MGCCGGLYLFWSEKGSNRKQRGSLWIFRCLTFVKYWKGISNPHPLPLFLPGNNFCAPIGLSPLSSDWSSKCSGDQGGEAGAKQSGRFQVRQPWLALSILSQTVDIRAYFTQQQKIYLFACKLKQDLKQNQNKKSTTYLTFGRGIFWPKAGPLPRGAPRLLVMIYCILGLLEFLSPWHLASCAPRLVAHEIAEDVFYISGFLVADIGGIVE